jgi:hypothetical protein
MANNFCKLLCRLKTVVFRQNSLASYNRRLGNMAGRQIYAQLSVSARPVSPERDTGVPGPLPIKTGSLIYTLSFYLS